MDKGKELQIVHVVVNPFSASMHRWVNNASSSCLRAGSERECKA